MGSSEEKEEEMTKEQEYEAQNSKETVKQADIIQEPEETIGDYKEEVSKKKEEKKNSAKSLIRELIIYALLLFVCIRIVPNYVIQRTIVDGPSMESTLFNKEQLMVEKISYHLDKLDRFDIIAFYPYGKDVDEYYIKRIIGMPGETVQIKGKDIYINGEVLEEHYGKDPITSAGIANTPIHLLEDEYFVLGDNRAVSLDSRSEEVGVVHKNEIGGRAILRIWPLSKFGTLD